MIRLILLHLCCNVALAQTQSVQGTVIDSITNIPISRVKVSLILNGGREAVLTDGSGSFTFAGVPPGKYSLSVERPNYVPENGLLNDSVVVEPDKPPPAIQVTLRPTAKLSGNVFDENGLPFPFAYLQFFKKIVSEGRATMQQINTQGTSDDLGEYRVATLEAGQYFVCATATANSYQKSHHLTYRNPCVLTEEPGSAELLSLRAGEERRMDLHLKPISGIRLSGSIDVGTADPAASLSMHLRRIDSNGVHLSSFLNVSFDSKTAQFNAEEIPPGDYLLFAQGNWIGRNVNTRQVVHVGTEDIRDFKLTLNNSTYFSGSVQMEGSVPVQNAVEVHQSRFTQQISIQVLGSGEFRQIIDPGRFEVRVIPPAGWMVHSVMQGGVDPREQNIVIHPDGLPEPIRISLSQGGSTLEVALDSASQEKAVKIVLLRRSSLGDGWVQEGQPRNFGVMRTTRMIPYTQQGARLKQDGMDSVKISHLPPGDYRILGLPLVGEIEYLSPEVMRSYQDYDKFVSVHDGETTKVVIKPLRLK